MTTATELQTWLNGTATGGPESDGRYPLTYADGLTYLVYCPAAQALNPLLSEQPIELFAATAGNAADTATAEADEAIAAATSAAADAASALSSKNSAATSATSALASKNAAATSATNAATSAANAAASETTASTAAAAVSGAAGAHIAATGDWNSQYTPNAGGFFYENNGASNQPTTGFNWAGLNLVGFSAANQAQFAVALTAGSPRPFIRARQAGTDSAWYELAKLDSVVQLTGTQTVGGAKTYTGNPTVQPVSGGSQFKVYSPDTSNVADVIWGVNGSTRWFWRKLATAESGGNAGSDLTLQAADDSGVALGVVLTVTRATRVVSFNVSPTGPTPTAGDNSTKLATTAYVATAVAAGGGGTPGLILVGSTTNASAATSLSLSGLDLATHKRYRLEFIGRNAGTSAVNLSLNYNSDTTAANYNRQHLSASSSTVNGSRVADALAGSFAALANASCDFAVDIWVDANGKTRSRVQSVNGAPSTQILQDFIHAWDTTNNVTSLQIVASVASGIAAGATLKLYRYY